MIESEYLPKANMSEVEKREKYGCVMRAIESFYGAKATDEEWKMRLDDVILKTETAGKYASLVVPKFVYLAQKNLLERDFDDVRNFIMLLSLSNTPLGLSIGKTQSLYSKKTASEVLRTLTLGNDIMVMYGIKIENDPKFKYLGHMAHLMYAPNRDRVISLSDGHISIPLNPETIYRVIERV